MRILRKQMQLLTVLIYSSIYKPTDSLKLYIRYKSESVILQTKYLWQS